MKGNGEFLRLTAFEDLDLIFIFSEFLPRPEII